MNKPTARSAQKPRPRQVIVCAGLKGSGSTWLYNVVSKILMRAAKSGAGLPRPQLVKPKIMQFYADSVSAFPPQASRASHLIIKTHVPDPSLNVLAAFSHACVFLTLREPRDSIASVMRRFDHPFARSLGELAASSERLTALSKNCNPQVFRYEERFFDTSRTVTKIAKLLGLSLHPDAIEEIFEQHTRAAVRRRIQALERRGIFGAVPHPDRFDPATHWHPGHVGDAENATFAAVLSSPQQQAVLSATACFRRLFHYSGGQSARRK